jgi:mannose-1-phosphate guanylyltransferase
MGSLYAVVLAGGSGTRFWPLSRRSHPKQLLNLTPDGTLLSGTLKRVESVIEPSRWWLVCGDAHLDGSKQAVPDMPVAQMLSEPCGRNTAPAIGLAAITLLRNDPDAMMVVLPADHHVAASQPFCDALKIAAEAAASGTIITLGIAPTRPETGYGYIEKSEGTLGVDGAFKVKRFCEKPNLEQAQAFLEQGNFVWNAGIFVMRCDVLLKEMKRQLPSLHAALEAIAGAIGTDDYRNVLETQYNQLSGISIDYGIMEGAESVGVVPVECGWSDVGSFSSLDAVLKRDAAQNLTSGKVVALDSTNCTLYATEGHVVGVVGMSDVVVVHSPDATLVIPTERAQEVRNILKEMEERKWDEYL